MNKTGIWMDKRVAKIATLNNETEVFSTIKSDIEEYKPKGGSGTSMKGGPQDVVQDSKYLEREKHQFKEFFTAIAQHIKDVDELVIFGPAQTGEKFRKELAESHPQTFAKITALKSADSMTDKQVKSWVRDYFSA